MEKILDSECLKKEGGVKNCKALCCNDSARTFFYNKALRDSFSEILYAAPSTKILE